MKAKKIVLAVIGVLAAAFVFLAVQRLLMPKYQKGIIEGSMIEEYYKAEEPHEVLFLGDCEVYENFSPVKMYREYGISSYIRGSGEQYIWQSYYLLRDTLRHETPRVVVLTIHSLQFDESRVEEYNRMTLDGMNWTSDKVEAIKASMMADEHFIDYIFPILRFHYRWNELEAQDIEHFFTKDRISYNGYYMRCDVKPFTGFPPKPPLGNNLLGERPLSYLAKIADLCEKKGIKLVLIKAPTEYPFWYEEWDEQIEAFAAPRGLPYLNMIGNEEIGLDWQTDTYDAGLHMNLSGAEKMAVYMGRYLKDHYELTDYRDDPEVSAVWNDICVDYDNMARIQQEQFEQFGEIYSFGTTATN